MTKKRILDKSRGSDKLLVVVASVWLVLNVCVVAVGALSIGTFGWWSALIIAGGLSSVGLSIMAIKTREPAWLLLDLLLPN